MSFQKSYFHNTAYIKNPHSQCVPEFVIFQPKPNRNCATVMKEALPWAMLSRSPIPIYIAYNRYSPFNTKIMFIIKVWNAIFAIKKHQRTEHSVSRNVTILLKLVKKDKQPIRNTLTSTIYVHMYKFTLKLIYIAARRTSRQCSIHTYLFSTLGYQWKIVLQMRNGLAAFNYFENGMFTLCFDNKPFF